MRPVRLLLAALPLVFFSCAQPEEEPTDDSYLAPPAEGTGFQMSMDYTVPPHSEAWICEVYPIPVDEIAPVNSVEYKQTPGMHHMTISTPGFSDLELEHGVQDCEPLYEQAMDGLTMIFGSQGTDQDTMQLPVGVAANLPATLDILHEMHYVNVSDEPVHLYSRINAMTIPIEEVQQGIWGGQVRDESITIPADSEHTEWTRCLMNRDVEVLFLASHTHDLGVEFTVAPFDGTTVGEIFYRNTDLHSPMIVQYEPPMVLPEGQGFEYTCTWRNPNDHPVEYGTSTLDEMCNLAIVHTPFDMGALCEVVETSDGVIWQP